MSSSGEQPYNGPHLQLTVQNQSLKISLIFSCSPLWGKQNLCFHEADHLVVREAESMPEPHATTRTRCCLPAPLQLTPHKRQSRNMLVAKLTRKWCFLQEKHIFFIIFSFCSYYFSEGGGELSRGIPLEVYITGEKNNHFLSNQENCPDADKYHCPEAELLLLTVAEKYT